MGKIKLFSLVILNLMNIQVLAILQNKRVQGFLRKLIKITLTVFCLLLLFSFPTRAQTHLSPFEDSALPVQSEGELPSPKRQKEEITQPTVEKSAEKSSSPLKRFLTKRTYERSPDPYDMEAIEAYDQEVYGAGR